VGDTGEPSVREYAEALADGIDAALPTWVVTCIERAFAAAGRDIPPEVQYAAEVAGDLARREAGGRVRALLSRDIEDQPTNPLAILRWAVRYPTEVLRQAGMPPVVRDRFAAEAFPDDPYDLSPASFADVNPGLVDLGIAWGAAKAFEHRRRHRSQEEDPVED
jgi:hypothetical protein